MLSFAENMMHAPPSSNVSTAEIAEVHRVQSMLNPSPPPKANRPACGHRADRRHAGRHTRSSQIRVQGQPASLTEIKEGARVKAFYEVRDGKNVARMIDVTAEKLESATQSRVALGAKLGSAPTQ